MRELGQLRGAAAEEEMRRLTRRSFLTGTGAALAGLGAWRWLTTAETEDGIPWPLRRFLRFNQRLAEGLASPHRLAPTFPQESVVGDARTNGLVGLSSEVAADSWQIRVEHEGRNAETIIRLNEIETL